MASVSSDSLHMLFLSLFQHDKNEILVKTLKTCPFLGLKMLKFKDKTLTICSFTLKCFHSNPLVKTSIILNGEKAWLIDKAPHTLSRHTHTHYQRGFKDSNSGLGN